MKRIKTIISFIFTKSFYHKAIAYALLVAFLVFFKSFALISFLTFIFAYLFYTSSKFVKEKIESII
jgi:hypothetical protein